MSLNMPSTRQSCLANIGAIVKQIGYNKFAGFSMVYNFVNIGDEKKFALKNLFD